MIITQTPFRMSFFGGGTDMESFFRENGGAVLSTTFDKYCYVNKDVEIGDCVWLGNNVIILGGGENWRRSDNSSWLSSVQRYSAICGSRWPSGNSVQI